MNCGMFISSCERRIVRTKGMIRVMVMVMVMVRVIEGLAELVL